MGSNTRQLQYVAAAAAAAATVALLVDDDGSTISAIAFAAVALTWLTMPGVARAGHAGRASALRIAAFVSIAASASMLVVLLIS